MAVICTSLPCVEMVDLELTLWHVASTILALRRDERILLKLPKYLSLLVILFGLGWLALLPLNEYSRRTYVSENGASYSLPPSGCEHILRTYDQHSSPDKYTLTLQTQNTMCVYSLLSHDI